MSCWSVHAKPPTYSSYIETDGQCDVADLFLHFVIAYLQIHESDEGLIVKENTAALMLLGRSFSFHHSRTYSRCSLKELISVSARGHSRELIRQQTEKVKGSKFPSLVLRHKGESVQ